MKYGSKALLLVVACLMVLLYVLINFRIDQLNENVEALAEQQDKMVKEEHKTVDVYIRTGDPSIKEMEEWIERVE